MDDFEESPEELAGQLVAFPAPSTAADTIDALTRSLLEHALDAHHRKLKTYESLKNLNDVIGTQYGDRVLFELLQNAHDAHRPDEEGEISIRLVIDGPDRGELLVANKGRPFTASNLEAIRNIGTSDKEIGEGIGNKGLGFRSVEALTDDVHIFSAGRRARADGFDGYCFRFATANEIEERLGHLGASTETAVKVASNVSRYLVPVTAQEQSNEVRRLAKEGYATVVVLPLATAVAVELARKQVATVLDAPAPVLLFLDRLSSLEAAVIERGQPPRRTQLTRKVAPIEAKLPQGFQMERVTLDRTNAFLVARQVLPKPAVLDAVRASIAAAPPLKRWLSWKGDAVVSVAVPLNSPMLAAPRLFNFLPMDDRASSPMAGHIDAPFFADIDRRSIKADLPLNNFLLEAAARTAVQAALSIVDGDFRLPQNVVVDLAAWSAPHTSKVVEAFAALGRPLAEAAIWPVVPGGPARWVSFNELYAWPDIRTHQLTPAKLASVADATILFPTIGEGRLARVRALAAAVSLPLAPNQDILSQWSEAIAAHLAAKARQSPRRWRDFYDDVVALYAAASVQLSTLEGKKLFPDNNDKLLGATARGLDGAPPVFHRVGKERGRRSEGPPSPPSSLFRKFRFLKQSIEISEASLRAFEKAGLLRRYDPLEVLDGLEGALSRSPTENQRREVLIWAYRVWRNAGGKAVEDGLRKSGLFVPCLGGWFAASDTSLSASWSTLGRMLELYLHEAAPQSADADDQKGKLVISFGTWPRAASDDRREDWLRFLGVLGVRDGLQPIAGAIHRAGTPSNFWNGLLFSGVPKLGLDAQWTAHARKASFAYPHTEYQLQGEVWRLPGQLEHSWLSPAAREALSDLIVAYLRENGEAHFTFRLSHWRGLQSVALPTPLQVFLRESPWPASLRRDEASFDTPSQSWSTTVMRQVPPRFVPRFSAEPGSRAVLPAILFDERIGLRDWAAAESAPGRLASLATALSDLSAAERRELREQLRRAWNDVAERQLTLGNLQELVVERSGGFELLAPDPEAPPVVHVTTERQGFAARALADRGEAVLDVGETDGAVIRDLLVATGGFTPRLADSGDVQLQVDGQTFQPNPTDPHFAAGSLTWLSDVAILAHEYLGDALELRTLPTDELDHRLRQIRLRRCDRFALLIDDQEITAHGDDRVQGVPHARLPTLLITGDEPISVDLLLEAAPAITKLVGSRRNTLEPMLGRLAREGYSDASVAPSEDMLARAIRRDVGVVRDHFAATRGGVDRRVRAVLPIVSFIRGRSTADSLVQRHDRLGPALKLRDWLVTELGADTAGEALAAIDVTDDQALIRRRMGFDFQAYGRTLAELGYPPLNSEADFRRLFSVFMAELAPALVDRVRRRFAKNWREGRDLGDYVALRKLEFVVFDPAWPMERETIDRDFVAGAASTAAEAHLGPDDPSITLPNFESVVAANRKLIASNHARLASLIRAWCRKKDVDRPSLMDTADPQPVVRALHDKGLIDFEAAKPESLPTLLVRVGAWPLDMSQTDAIEDLELTEADLQHEEREALEARRKADAEKRTITFGDQPLDTGGDGFVALFERLAETALAQGSDWFNRSRPPRLAIQEQSAGERRHPGASGGKGQAWRNQPPDSVRQAMGIASEWLAREYLRRRHPKEMTDDCWVSSNRTSFCTGSEGDDSLGYDFRIETARHEYLYEVKSALDEGGEFELTARELEIAGSASLERKRRFRILYVPFVFDPSRWRVLPLSNPVSAGTRNRFRVVRSGSVRYRFERR
ncbi:sacsin N-terminal ATP-binding-like domain-containing protein [Bradyrhizobium australafricanum]|uniref:sacsin N-terminal ATP-binding-like domain-containing protein n=1 Tax=Bradyrhizobium australafricanum TaxID=2821406 RepID=UPI001CE33F84|nr:DUF3883 domain-containing protein [Bradyrhizobium australafricanum]MCA6098158.1 DUF3883 domain-containing protein [Bradyrhizobium australafricanum]